MTRGTADDEEHEHTGLDLTVHAGTAYDHGVLGHGAPVTASVQSPTALSTPSPSDPSDLSDPSDPSAQKAKAQA
jgi:hypothetical protein